MRHSWLYTRASQLLVPAALDVILVSCIYTIYNIIMIKCWRHKGLKNFYETGSKAGIQPKHADLLAVLLLQLASAIKAKDMNTPGNDFHELRGDLKGYFSIKVNGNWRIIFQFLDENAILVDYVDYH
jgi:proteic killer suppression protein